MNKDSESNKSQKRLNKNKYAHKNVFKNIIPIRWILTSIYIATNLIKIILLYFESLSYEEGNFRIILWNSNEASNYLLKLLGVRYAIKYWDFNTQWFMNI